MTKIQCIPASVSMFENIPEPTDYMGVLKFLELVGRTCYKSEERITDDSCVKFINNMEQRKHRAMLEHYIFTLEIDREDWDNFVFYTTYQNGMSDVAQKMKFINLSTHVRSGVDPKDFTENDTVYLVSGSATSWNYLLEAFIKADCIGSFDNSNPAFRISEYMNSLFPVLFRKYDNNHAHDGVKYPGHCPGRNDLRLLSRNEIRNLPIDIRRYHDFMSFRMICDRGVTHEMVRMRVASFGQESTRYCNYGDKGFQFIIPCWIPHHDKKVLQDSDKVAELLKRVEPTDEVEWPTITWLDACEAGAEMYETLLKDYNWQPQQARSVLPHSIKTELVVTATLAEWEHIFDMRVPSSAHPQMRELAIPMLRLARRYCAQVFAPKEAELAQYMGDF